MLVEMKEFFVVGLSVRTTNKNGKAKTDIGSLFGQFIVQKTLEKIPNKESSDIYCVYTDYEGDHTQPYTCIIGCRVQSGDSVPKGLVIKKILASKYQVYKSHGNLAVSVGETWGQIWQSDLKRKYFADFDIYGPKAQDMNDPEVETYVGVL